MANKRKYPKVVGYWVYTIYIPSVAKYYVGISKQQCYLRWRKASYKGVALEPYLSEWDNMEKIVIQDNLTKEEALKKEDELIQELRVNDLCINSKRSGLIANDKNVYMSEYYKNNKEYRERTNQQRKQWQEDNKEKWNEYRRQRYLKKKLQQQQTQLTLFDIAS